MKYVQFDPLTGELLQWGEGPTLPAGALEHTIPGTLEDYFVDVTRMRLRPKSTMVLNVPGPTPADGMTEAVVSGLPVGTRCSFYVNGDPFTVQVDDGTLEVALHDAQTLSVRLWHPRYRHPNIELEFV